jgi:GDPmannose 4,6-dehydratase
MKKALITGITGQDGSYLAEHLLTLGYDVFGLVRRDPESVPWMQSLVDKVTFLYGDMRDSLSLAAAFEKADPDEVYALAAQVFIPTSWVSSAETFDVNVGGLARLFQIVERLKPETRVYQASSSEMYGNVGGIITERSPFIPKSPYGVSKLAAHELCRVYREKGIYAVGGILFNHESPRRGPEMVTRKITRAVAAWVKGDRTGVKLGNLEARRDWGFAGDYVRAMHLMLQRDTPQDYIIGTGESHSVREFVEAALNCAGLSVSVDAFAQIDSKFIRKNEIHNLVGDPSLAMTQLGWVRNVNFSQLVAMMVEADCGV